MAVNLNENWIGDKSRGIGMSIRDDRMKNDYRALQKLCVFYEPEKIKILEKQGEPPNFYRLLISDCKGIEAVVDGLVQYRTEHILIIRNFPVDYPDSGSLPTFQMETPIFHPNVYDNGLIDLGSNFSEWKNISLPLDALVQNVISMIEYENLRFGCPANINTRDWANRNKHLFPLSNGLDGGQTKPKLNWK